VDAVVLLDVLEHVADPSAVIAEVHRVLRPGGYVVISVPHASPLEILDPMNAYLALRRRWPSWPGLEALVDSATGVHRHFAASEICALLGPDFTVERVARTGLGLSEVLRLLLIVTFKGFLRWERVYRGLWFLPLAVYLLDDLIPAGPLSYHLTIGARAVAPVETRVDAGAPVSIHDHVGGGRR
jgi:SAM-dependent methyltransferase